MCLMQMKYSISEFAVISFDLCLEMLYDTIDIITFLQKSDS